MYKKENYFGVQGDEMKFIIISNNPQVEKKYGLVEMVDGGILNILVKARDYIHRGHSLLMHPLAGSIKPNETPYKSLLISKETNPEHVDLQSLELIENAIITHKKFKGIQHQYPEAVLLDFQTVDLELVKSAMESIG